MSHEPAIDIPYPDEIDLVNIGIPKNILDLGWNSGDLYSLRPPKNTMGEISALVVAHPRSGFSSGPADRDWPLGRPHGRSWRPDLPPPDDPVRYSECRDADFSMENGLGEEISGKLPL